MGVGVHVMPRRGHKCRCCQACATSLIATIGGLPNVVPAFEGGGLSNYGMFAKGIAPLARYNTSYRLFRRNVIEADPDFCSHLFQERINNQFLVSGAVSIVAEISRNVTQVTGRFGNQFTRSDILLTLDALCLVSLRLEGNPLQNGTTYVYDDFELMSQTDGIDFSGLSIRFDADDGQTAVTPCECYSQPVFSTTRDYQTNCLAFTGGTAPSAEILLNDDVAVSCNPSDGWCREYGQQLSVSHTSAVSTVNRSWRTYGDDELEVELGDFVSDGGLGGTNTYSVAGTYYLPYVGNTAFANRLCGFGLGNLWGPFFSPQHCWASAFEFTHDGGEYLLYVSVTIPTRLERCTPAESCTTRRVQIHVAVDPPPGTATVFLSQAYTADQDTYSCGNFTEVSGGPGSSVGGSCTYGGMPTMSYTWTIRQA
jgi:hypothetical protein